jgi:inhibitor of cysteine peptidase
MKLIVCLTIFCLLALTITALVGCGRGEAISGTGTVKFVDLEGGFYGIVGDDGQKYDPMNLDQTYQEDGLRVRFQAKIRQDMVSIYMWGTIIELTKIEILK